MDHADPRLAALHDALATVLDPELGLDILTLGLVHDVTIADDVALVTHTLTARGCPMERVITAGIRGAAMTVEGLRDVETRLVWEPAWHPGLIARNAWCS